MAARPKGLILAALVAAGALLLACGPAGDSAPGNDAPQASKPAARIVSLVPAPTEMLFAIGAGPQVVGVSSFDEFPPEVKALPRVGALLDPDTERVLSLQPDLVIAYGSQEDVQAQFMRAGIRMFTYRHGGISRILDTISELGRITGHEQEAAARVRDIQARLDAVRARVKDRERPAVMLVMEREPASLRGLYASGGQGFLHEMLEIAGGRNVFADVARESVQPSHETMLMRAPDVILDVAAADLMNPRDVPADRRVWSALPSLPAVRRERVHFLRGQYLVVPGPRLVEATEAFARALHPAAFAGS